VLAQAVLVALAISLQAAQAHQEQEQVLAVAVAEQDLLALVQMLLPITAATVAQAVVVEALLPH
jgi:hypothetical protein